jgi:nitroimidazol reductase NimA-like FMN-containing flavoprotein (pyridoxamine 5'-phosphate oxidase superfamily)
MTSVDPRGSGRELDVLDEDECRRPLGTAAIGRTAFTPGALPAIQPVHFALLGDHVVIPTRHGSKAAAAARGAVVAFEVDEFDTDARTGWSVTVVGPSRIVDADEFAELEAVGLRPWAATDQPCYIAIRAVQWHGRRLGAPARAAAGR